jgi:biopolymer transport protein ExbB
MSQFWKFLVGEWYFAVPMILMSITGLALVIWRLLLNLNARTDLNEFLPAFQDKLDKQGVDGALSFCRKRTDMIPRKLFVAGLETSKQGGAAMRRAMANAIELEILPDLNFLLPPILAIAKVATMVGLLGTVLSMIGTFTKIQEAIDKARTSQTKAATTEGAKDKNATPTEESTDVTSHSGAIGLALFATALGLVTAIPLVFSHVLFRAWITRFELKMKSSAQKLLTLVQSKQAASGTAAPARAAPAAANAADAQAVRR